MCTGYTTGEQYEAPLDREKTREERRRSDGERVTETSEGELYCTSFSSEEECVPGTLWVNSMEEEVAWVYVSVVIDCKQQRRRRGESYAIHTNDSINTRAGAGYRNKSVTTTNKKNKRSKGNPSGEDTSHSQFIVDGYRDIHPMAMAIDRERRRRRRREPVSHRSLLSSSNPCSCGCSSPCSACGRRRDHAPPPLLRDGDRA